MLRELLILARHLALLVLLPLLPEKPRQRLADRHGMGLHHASVVSGIAEMALSFLVFDLSYRATMARWTDQQLTVIGENADQISQRLDSAFWNPLNVAIYSGPLNLVAFLLTPQGFLSAYLFFEGTLRAALSSASGEAVGSGLLAVPWAAGTRLRDAARARARRLATPPPRADRLRTLQGKHGGGLLLDTDRPRDGLEPEAAVWFRDRPYRLARVRRRREGMRTVARYLLRPWPPGAAMRRQVRLELLDGAPAPDPRQS